MPNALETLLLRGFLEDTLRRFLNCSLLTSLFFLLSACGDDAPPAGPDCTTDTTGPIASTVPASPVQVVSSDGTATIQVNFSEDVVGLTAASFASDDATITSLEGSERGYQLSLSGLTPGVTATVTLAPAGVADLCGNGLGADFTFDVVVVQDACGADTTAPQVRSIPPSPIVLDAGTTSTTVTLLFNEEVTGVDGAVTADNEAVVDSVTPNAGAYDVAVSNLMAGMTTLTVGGGVTDACGNALTPATFVIDVPAVDTVAPTVVSTDPADAAVDVNFRSAIDVVFSEEMDRTAGTATVQVAGADVPMVASWSADGTTLTLTPLEPYGFTATVAVTLSGYADTSGNTLAADEVFSFTTGADPCSGLPATVSATTTSIIGDGSTGAATLGFALDGDFALTDADLSLTATSGGSGTLTAGTLAGGPDWTVDVTGIANGETYTLDIGAATSADGCTDLTPASIPVSFRPNLPTGSGTCPLPPTLPNNYGDADMCDERTNDSLATAADTGFTLSSAGDAFSISGIYDSDTIGASDNEFYLFDVASDGSTVTDVTVSIAYGCTFTGTGTRSTTASPDIDILDASGTSLAAFVANDAYGDVDGSGNFGFGSSTASLILPPGTSTLALRVDDVSGTNWCMDFVMFVELTDNSRPAGCSGIPPTVTVDGSAQTAFQPSPASDVTVTIPLSSDYPLTEGDITVTPTNGGSGTLVAGSFSGSGSNYAIDITGAADMDTYDVSIAAGSSVCSDLSAGFIPVTISQDLSGSAACPLPVALPQHHTANDMCGATSTNDTLATSETTGFNLANPGDRFSVGGIYDSDPFPDVDYFSFEIAESGTELTELELTFTYGCTFTGTGTRSTTTGPEMELLDDAGNSIGVLVGEDTYGDIDGSGNFGFGRATFRVGGPTGNNRYHVVLDDISGINWCMDWIMYVEMTDNTLPLACIDAGPTAAVAASGASAIDESGTAIVPIVLNGDFQLQQSDLTLTATNGGSGTLVASSLSGAGSYWTVEVAGAATGDTYDLSLAARTDSCGTALSAGTIAVGIIGDPPTGAGACPLPGPLGQHHTAADACDATGTNTTLATSEPTGFTLASSGDRFSIGGIYESDGSDNDYFSFDLTESGTEASDIQVSFAYGCNFTGTGSRSSTTEPEVEFFDDSGSSIGVLVGGQTYGNVDGSGNYGFGQMTFRVGGAAGNNTYHVRIDDILGSSWCMDWIMYVELVDNTIPISCLSAAPTASLIGTSELVSAGTATVPIELDNPFLLVESDLTLTPITGTGTMVGGSLAGSGTSYTVDITGLAAGDSYDLSVASRTDSCSTTLTAGTISIGVTALPAGGGTCPLPATLTSHTTSPDACDANTHATDTTALSTGVTLVAAGDAFSVGGIMDSDSIGGSDNDYYSFSLTADGTSSYELQVSVVYGCSFTGGGTPGNYAPVVEIRNSSDVQIGADIDGVQTYSSLNGSGNYGNGISSVTLGPADAPTGTNTYFLNIDDDVGTNWCMDYQIYVQLDAIN